MWFFFVWVATVASTNPLLFLRLQGVIIKSIPFTEPSHVPQILRFLRQQSLFNTLITSCIRTSNYKSGLLWKSSIDYSQTCLLIVSINFAIFQLVSLDIESTTMFEISVLSCQHITITMEHPFMETMATIELDLTSMPNIKCNIFSMGGAYSGVTSGLSRILQTCASIPITIRTLIKYWEREHMNKMRGLDITSLSLFCSQGGNVSGKQHKQFATAIDAFHLEFDHNKNDCMLFCFMF